MINNISKMHRTNKKGLEWLKGHGYMVEVIAHTRFSKDLFGIADAIAIKDGEVYFVQMKTNAFGSDKKYDEFFHKYHVNILVMMFKDRVKEPYMRSWSMLPRGFFATKQSQQT